jgi:hypothetical protein
MERERYGRRYRERTRKGDRVRQTYTHSEIMEDIEDTNRHQK